MPTPHPMLAAKDVAASKLRFPMLLSPKIDGVRAFVWEGVVYSRSLKPIPNKHVQLTYGRRKYHGFDGELVVGEPNAPDVFNKTQSGVMSIEGQPDVSFLVFDLIDSPVKHAMGRMHDLIQRFMDIEDLDISLVTQHRVESIGQVDMHESELLERGYEGVMLRPVDALYKHGRATPRGQELVKVKRFEDAEARVVGYEELAHNQNAQEVNELGRTKRSTAKAGRVPGGVLGALVCEDLTTGQCFKIGTGFDAAMREALWAERSSLVGRIVKYKHQPHGRKEAPRLPVFIGFRSAEDMS